MQTGIFNNACMWPGGTSASGWRHEAAGFSLAPTQSTHSTRSVLEAGSWWNNPPRLSLPSLLPQPPRISLLDAFGSRQHGGLTNPLSSFANPAASFTNGWRADAGLSNSCRSSIWCDFWVGPGSAPSPAPSRLPWADLPWFTGSPWRQSPATAMQRLPVLQDWDNARPWTISSLGGTRASVPTGGTRPDPVAPVVGRSSVTTTMLERPPVDTTTTEPSGGGTRRLRGAGVGEEVEGGAAEPAPATVAAPEITADPSAGSEHGSRGADETGGASVSTNDPQEGAPDPMPEPEPAPEPPTIIVPTGPSGPGWFEELIGGGQPRPEQPAPIAPPPPPPPPAATVPEIPTPPAPPLAPVGQTDPVPPPATSEPASPAGIAILPPAAPLTANEMANLEELYRMSSTRPVSANDKSRANEIYAQFRLDPRTLAQLENTAAEVAAQVFDPRGANFGRHASNWSSYSETERKAVVEEFVDTLNEMLNLSVEVGYMDQARVNGFLTHGYFSSASRNITLNTHPESSFHSFSHVLKVIFHEMMHAAYFDKATEIGSPTEAIEMARNGEIDYAMAMTYFNARPGLYISYNEFGESSYILNPHEQVAFTAQHFWEKEAAARGVTDNKPTLRAANPLFRNLREHGFA